MASPLKTMLDPRRVALMRARLHAWWEGEAFDPAAVAAEAGAEPLSIPAQDHEEEAPLEPRIEALTRMWGARRLTPGEDGEDQLQPARLMMPATGTLAVFGPGLAGPVTAAGRAHPGAIQVFEWREEALAACMAGLRTAGLGARATCAAMDLDLFAAPAEAWDGAWSLDEFSYAASAPRLAQQLAKGLKPGAHAVVEAYVGPPDDRRAAAFATAFAEPHILMDGDLIALFTTAGLALEEREDITGLHVGAAREGFKRLEPVLQAAVEGSLTQAVAREIAWEAESWRVRLIALQARRLQRLRLLLRKP